MILETKHSKIDLQEIFKKRFNLQVAEFMSKWIAEREKTEDIPETIKYNISSFIYVQHGNTAGSALIFLMSTRVDDCNT